LELLESLMPDQGWMRTGIAVLLPVMSLRFSGLYDGLDGKPGEFSESIVWFLVVFRPRSGVSGAT
jgi:hypothetical protein